MPDSSAFITPIAAAPPRTTAPPPRTVVPPATAPVSSESFSIPSLARLEQGKYYVQLSAYNIKEQVEAAVAKIGKAYPLAVQNVGTQDNPMFRLLVGPVNLGESGALLQRFKGSGYKDAFIRQGN
jgi:cell division septation protein DedD